MLLVCTSIKGNTNAPCLHELKLQTTPTLLACTTQQSTQLQPHLLITHSSPLPGHPKAFPFNFVGLRRLNDVVLWELLVVK
ncbi:hypothetical protein ACFX13_046569 [Malus domestica]